MEAIVNGVPLIVIVVGLVEVSKRLGVKGKAAVAVSLGLGVVLGVGYQLSLAVPVDFAGYFGAAVYGLALGLSACGLYDVATRRSLEKAGQPPQVP
jgi:hypothetical protein